MIIATVLLASLMMWYLYAATRDQAVHAHSGSIRSSDSAFEHARHRLAAGEIDAEEYSRLLKTLIRPS